MHYLFHCLCAKLLQSCPTICDAMDSSLPDSSVPWHSPGKNTGVGCHTLLQVTVPNQEWNARPLCLLHWCVCMLSHFGHVWLCAPLWTIACQAPLSTGFPRQEYWGGVPCLLPTLAGRFFTTSASWEAPPFSAVVVAVQSLSHVQLFATPWTAARQTSLSFTISQSLLRLMSIESVIPSNHLVLCYRYRVP